MTLQYGDYTFERQTLNHCDVCAQQEVDGIRIDASWEDKAVSICVDCFTRALKLPTEETVDRLRVLIADLEHELTRCRFPNPGLLTRLKRAAGSL